jgi:nucleoside-diphosphate-sugar epimerase
LVCRIGYQPASDTDYQPTTPYGVSKVRTEQIWRAADGGGTTWCLTRPTTIWGPHMNPHYLRFFRMIRDGRYVHVSGGPHWKSYGYVGNTAFQYQRLLEAPASQVHRRAFWVADYDPLNLEAWAERFRAELAAPPIRTIPRGVAAAGARLGDALVRLGWRSFPFTTFRLTNVVTSYIVDLTATQKVCGELPFDQDEGVVATAAWLREIWETRPAAGALLAMPTGGSRT